MSALLSSLTEAHKSELNCQSDVVTRAHPIQKKKGKALPLTEHTAGGAPRYMHDRGVTCLEITFGPSSVTCRCWWAGVFESGEIENLTQQDIYPRSLNEIGDIDILIQIFIPQKSLDFMLGPGDTRINKTDAVPPLGSDSSREAGLLGTSMLWP